MIRYFVIDNWTTLDSGSRWYIGEIGRAARVDDFRSRCAAEYACRALNDGRARINPHALRGLRVEVLSEARP